MLMEETPVIRFMLLTLGVLALVPFAPQSCPLAGTTTDDTDGSTTVVRGTLATTAEAETENVMLTEDLRVPVGYTVELRAVVTDGGEGISYAWVQTAGAGVALTNARSRVANFVTPSLEDDDTLRFLVTTWNADGDVGQAETAVTVAADTDYVPFVPGGTGTSSGGEDRPEGPEAVAGEEQSVAPGDTVTLDGTDSTGNDLTYAWHQISGTTVELETDDDDEGIVTFTAPGYESGATNTLEFRLTVTDSVNRSVTDEVSVIVRNPDTLGTRVRIETTMGNITVELFDEDAPLTVENFLAYVDDGFYTNTIFHRVIAGFVVQGGGFLTGMTPKTTNDPVPSEADNGLLNERGTVAMARTSNPDSATSQFYFNLIDNDFLDASDSNAGYTVFGQVLTGLSVIDRIATVETGTVEGYEDVPLEDVRIRSVERIEEDSE